MYASFWQANASWGTILVIGPMNFTAEPQKKAARSFAQGPRPWPKSPSDVNAQAPLHTNPLRSEPVGFGILRQLFGGLTQPLQL